MNTTFHKIDMATWPRRDEFEHFSKSGCGFTMTGSVDITHLLEFGRERGYKLYPLLVYAAMRVINSHIEYRYGNEGGFGGAFGYYEVLHPQFFERTPSGNITSLTAEYSENVHEMVSNIEAVRAKYKGVDEYEPQSGVPGNVISISCAPWVHFSGVALSIQYVAEYYTPIITFGKYELIDGKTMIPLAVYVNHAVCDGFHCAAVITEVQRVANEL